MRAGNLDRVITIQGAATTINPNGTPLETWSDLETVRAQVVQASTDEYIRGNGATDKTVIVFRTWWIDGITNANRVIYNGQNFNIKETKEIGRRNGLELRCEAIS
jgi:SPP1 family predicted phage head-tail adaptor